MLISPPFLPPLQANEAAFIDAAMPECTDYSHGTNGAPQGSFPLVTKLTWHNGMHLKAPRDAQQQLLPVRAIADGTVIFRRDSAAHSDDPQHPLNYNPFGHDAAWSDTGMVIVRHTTDIGATGNTPTQITFYSAYMHLRHIEPGVQPGKPIWRKDAIGTPGRIYGREGRLHFEICMDTRNLQTLLGPSRNLKWTEPDKTPNADGRTDAVFGSIYIYLPAGTPVRSSAPKSHLYAGPTAGASAATDHFVPGTLRQAQWVEIRYGPSGTASQGGDAMITSYRAMDGAGGLKVGQRIGDPHVETDFEYNMYVEANSRHNSLSAADQARSSPSGWYELLRFGRNLGPDPLPANAAHWRPIPTDTGHVWADLNAPGTFKFSDADFPAFRGWQCFDDDTSPLDQRCDSVELKRLIRDPAQPETIRQPDVLAKRLSVPEVRDKLQYAICKFPTEWDKATITRRYEWLKTDEEFRMSEGHGWEEFAAHCEALCPDELPQEYKDADWHLHPKRFFSHCSQCGWLSATEFAQAMPRKLKHLSGSNFLQHAFFWNKAIARANTWNLYFNSTSRKYGLFSLNRRVHLLAQIIPETDYLRLVKEVDNRSGTYLKSKAYYPFYGRGLIQITWRENYHTYGKFRHFTAASNLDADFARLGWNPNELIASTNEIFDFYNCADTAGYYIISKRNMLKSMDDGISQKNSLMISRLVNGNVDVEYLNGLDARLQATIYCGKYFSNYPLLSSKELLEFEWRSSSDKKEILINGKNKKILQKKSWIIEVDLTPQRQ